MILEALNYAITWPLTTPGHRPFIRSSVNLWARARRCAVDWHAHEENSKAAMLAAIAELRQRRTAVVLGSGLLRDVPIEALCRAFDTVVLVDLVHLASVRTWLRLKGLTNVRLIERDLSGFDQLAEGKEADPLGFLRQFPALAASPLEQLESLEQLRVLWHGERIAVHVTQHAPGAGVDTPEDLARVQAIFQHAHGQSA